MGSFDRMLDQEKSWQQQPAWVRRGRRGERVPVIAAAALDRELLELGREYIWLRAAERAADEHYGRCRKAYDEAEPAPSNDLRPLPCTTVFRIRIEPIIRPCGNLITPAPS